MYIGPNAELGGAFRIGGGASFFNASRLGLGLDLVLEGGGYSGLLDRRPATGSVARVPLLGAPLSFFVSVRYPRSPARGCTDLEVVMAGKPAVETKPAVPGKPRKATPGAPSTAEHPVYGREELQEILAERESWTAGELAETLARAPRRRKSFQTDSGIPIPDVLDPASRAAGGLPARRRLPGPLPVHPRSAAHHVPRPALDHAPVRRLRLARGHQRRASSTCSPTA